MTTSADTLFRNIRNHACRLVCSSGTVLAMRTGGQGGPQKDVKDRTRRDIQQPSPASPGGRGAGAVGRRDEPGVRSGARNGRQADARSDRCDLPRSARYRAVSPPHKGRRRRAQLLALPPDPTGRMTGGDSTVDGDTELRLVQRLQAGDATALEGVMERYSARLYRLAFGITRSPRDAEEVL